MLARPPERYTVVQALKITEGGLRPVAYMEDEPNQCQRNSFCKTPLMWKDLETVINEYLGNITLQTILGEHKPADEYYI